MTRRFACTCACTCTCICACACIHACARACACVCVCVWHAYCICTCISHVHDICIAYVQLCPCPCGALAAASYFDRLRLSVVTFASDFRTFICSSTRAVSTIECEARIRASKRSPIDPSSALAANVRFAPATCGVWVILPPQTSSPVAPRHTAHDRTRNGVRSPREHRRLRGADGFDAASRPRSLSSNCTVCTDRERRPERPASNCPGSSDREHGRASRLRVREGS